MCPPPKFALAVTQAAAVGAQTHTLTLDDDTLDLETLAGESVMESR